MAINVPQIQPNSIQPPSPLGIASDYLNRQQQAQQYMGQSAIGLGETYNKLRQQKIAQSLEALKSISELYGAGGRRAVQSYAPTINMVAGANLIDTSQPQTQGQQPTMPGQMPSGRVGLPSQPSSGYSTPSSGISQGTSQAMGGQSGSMSPYVQASLDAGHPDIAGVGQRYGQSPMAQLNTPRPTTEDLQDITSGGTYGKNLAMTYKDLGDIGMQPMNAQAKQQEIYNTQPLTSDQIAVLNDPKSTSADLTAAFPNGVPPSVSQAVASRSLEKGKGSAEQQAKYNTPEAKIQNAAGKLQDLYEAYNKIPQGQKGVGVGLVTSKVGSVGGQAAPDLVTYNKLREAAAVSLAIARNPENVRPSPQDIQDELKNLPSAGDAPQVATNLFGSTARDLKSFHQINTQGAQAAAGAFGGSIQPGQLPKMNFNKAKAGPHGQTVTQNGHTYSWNGTNYE